MQHTITFKSDLDREPLRKLVERLVARVERRARRFRDDSLHLEVVVEQHPKRPLARATVTLHVPQGNLASRAENEDPVAAIREAFVEIERELEKHKTRVRHEHQWKKGRRGLRARILGRLRGGGE